MTDKVCITKVNETFSKIITEPGILMEIAQAFTFKVPGAQFSKKYKARVWDGTIKLINSMSGQYYSGLNYQIEQFCHARDYEVEYMYENTNEEFSLLEANQFIESLKLPKDKIPRDYQVEAFVTSVREGRLTMVSATSSGKSLTIYLLARYFNLKTLIIVPTINLVNQMYSDFKEYGYDSEKYVHRITGGEEKQTDKPIVVSTWQSIYNLPQKYFEQYNVIIGDEVHKFKAKSLIDIMTKSVYCKYRFGTTGTLDDDPLFYNTIIGLFGREKFVISAKELQDRGYAAPLQIKCIVLSYPDEQRKLVKSYKYPDEMDYLVRLYARNKFIYNLALSLKGNTLLLFRYVDKHGKPMYNEIKKNNPDRNIYYIDGSVTGNDREDIRKILETENNALLIASYGTYSTGANIKRLHNLIFSSPFKDKKQNLQSIGRTLRLHDTKETATLFDIADDLTWKSHKNYTLDHFFERVKVYASEQFQYKIYNVKLKV